MPLTDELLGALVSAGFGGTVAPEPLLDDGAVSVGGAVSGNGGGAGGKLAPPLGLGVVAGCFAAGAIATFGAFAASSRADRM